MDDPAEPAASDAHPDAMDAIGRRFQVAVTEDWLVGHPEDLEALRFLAYSYTATGRLEEALRADQRLVAMAPERAELHYDLACSFALLGRGDEAFASLEKAVSLGFEDRSVMVEDDDLESLRNDARWTALLARLPA